MVHRRSTRAWRRKKRIILGFAVLSVVIGAVNAGGTVAAWVTSIAAVTVATAAVLLVLRPARWYDHPSTTPSGT